jgi:hypothetical protein
MFHRPGKTRRHQTSGSRILSSAKEVKTHFETAGAVPKPNAHRPGHPTNLPNNSTRIAILKLDLNYERTPRKTISVAFVFVAPLFGHFYE